MTVGEQRFLVWSRPDKGSPVVSIEPSLSHALPGWGTNTRISPIFLADGATKTKSFQGLKGDCFLYFIGPINPADLEAIPVFRDRRCWVTYGLYNLVVEAWGEVRSLEKWLQKRGARYERWKVENGAVKSVRPSGGSRIIATDVAAELSELVTRESRPLLMHAVEEFACLLASCLTRCQGALPDYASQFAEMPAKVSRWLHGGKYPEATVVQLLTDLNAGLSRFSSQCFSGSSPIAETECHFWTHSFLGTGIANLALLRLRDFLEAGLSVADLSAEVTRLASEPPARDRLYRLELNDPLWVSLRPHVASTRSAERGFHLVPYFSGREGFRSTETTLSVPLAALPDCSEARWTLHTISHEVSHTIIRGALARLLRDEPDPGDASLVDVVEILNGRKTPQNLLQEARCFLYYTMWEMESFQGVSVAPDAVLGSQAPIESADDLWQLCEQWLPELEELLVHTFDFLYFHAATPDGYIKAIWKSWGVLPRIHQKKEEYLIRTLVAISLEFDGDGPAVLAQAKERLEVALERMLPAKSGPAKGPLQHVREALKSLKQQGDAFDVKLLVRLRIARFVKRFLYLQSLAMSFNAEAHAVSRRRSTKGYPHQAFEFSTQPFSNPLEFIKEFTVDAATPARSIWLLHQLALNWKPSDA